MQIDWWTLGLQAINFLVLVWLLWRFLYRPIERVVEKRKQLTERAFAEADDRKAEAEAARRAYEGDRAKLAEERQALLKKAHEELEAERSKVLDAAKRQADAQLDAASQSIATERKAALKQLRGQVAGMAAEMAAKLLREAGTGASADVFLERLEQRLADMPARERERLNGDVAASEAGMTVVTAAALTPARQQHWTERLNRRLGQDGKISFAADPQILGGAELRFPHAVLKFSWADQLKTAEEKLAEENLEGDEAAK